MAQTLTYEKVLAMFAETDRRLDKRFAETDKRFKETDRRLDKRFAETDRQFAETAQRFKETEELIKENAKNIGGISNTNGLFIEAQYINALKDAPCLGGKTFALARSNVALLDMNKRKDGSVFYKNIGEIDVLLEGADKIGIVEIKYRVRSTDVEELIEKKIKSYLKTYPQDEKKQIYLAIGGGSFEEGALTKAQKAGIAVLKLQSGVILDQSKKLKSYGAPEPKKTLGKTAKKAPAKRTVKKK